MVNLHPEYQAKLAMQRGEAALRIKRFDDAIAAFSEALSLVPDHARALAQGGAGLGQAGRDDEAIADLTRAIEVNPDDPAPNDPDAYLSRGLARLNVDDYQGAVADCERGLELKPGDRRGFFARGVALKKLGQYRRAEADYLEMLRLEPDESANYNQLAWLLATCLDDSVRDGPRAVEYATRACELSEWKNALLIDTLAAAHAECGQWELAVQRMEQALSCCASEQRDSSAAGSSSSGLASRAASREGGPPVINSRFLDYLRCPLDPASARLEAGVDALVCSRCKLAYPVRDDIPCLLPEEAVLPAGCERLEDLPCRRGEGLS
jgi:uncharacterized protein YbaR (Trm112 family)/Tfp pilus assembly protein PilF